MVVMVTAKPGEMAMAVAVAVMVVVVVVIVIKVIVASAQLLCLLRTFPITAAAIVACLVRGGVPVRWKVRER